MSAEEELNALRARLGQYATDRDPAIVLHPAALADALAVGAALQSGHRLDPEAVALVGRIHWQRYLLLPETDDREDLRSAVALFREVLPGRPELVPPEIAGFLSPVDTARELLTAAARRYADHRDTGDPRALDDAVSLATRAATDRDASAADRLASSRLLTVFHLARYQLYGAMEDLDASVEAGRTTIADGPAGDQGDTLSNLGLALRTRFERGGRLTDIVEAVDTHRRAVAATSAEDPALSRRLSNLGLALRIRYEQLGDYNDLAEAIMVARLAVQESPDDDGERFRRLTNLGLALRERFERDGDRADLDEAVAVGRAAVGHLALDHPDRAGVLLNLAGSLRAGTDGPNDPALAEAVDVLSEAVRVAEPSSVLGALAATHLGRAAAARGDWGLATDSFAAAIRTIDAIVRHGRRGDNEFHLARFAGLASDAAASALQAGDFERAAELWEHGHGVLLRQALDLSSEAETALAAAAPDLARELALLRDREAATGRSVRHREWNELIAAIRALPSFENFLHPAPAHELIAAAADGPIILVNVSRYRSDAIALTRGGVRIIPLPGLNPVVQQNRFAVFDRQPPSVNTDYLDQVLRWLWDTVAEPVLDGLHLDPVSGADLRRLWWCPSGPLAFLPLHAAGHHDDDRRIVMNRVVSSYTPTVTALIKARRQVAVPPGATQVLTVGAAYAPDGSLLPGVQQEVRHLVRRFPASTLLTGAEATADAVLRSLGDSPVVHLACHAVAYPQDPSASGLRLNDRMITVPEILAVRVPGAQLAYLSACSTAASGSLLPDESVNLASAFLLAGYRNVVANLWPIGDQVAARIAKTFYESLDENLGDPARALHVALRVMRDQYPGYVRNWACTIHVGP